MGDLVFALNYANTKDGKRETYDQAIDRVCHMHLGKFLDIGIDASIKAAFEDVKQKKVFASQRSLQYGGDAILKNNLRLYNCSYSNCDRLRWFAEGFYLLLSGAGTGLGLRKEHVNKLPKLISSQTLSAKTDILTYAINDSIEGWCDAVDLLIRSYHQTIHKNEIVQFSYDRIRKAGSKISSGGTAPGHAPLKNALEQIRGLIECSIVMGQERLDTLDCFDIACMLADVVLAGGRRRSALIALFDADDAKMLSAKGEDWYIDYPYRKNANISVVGVPNEVDRETIYNIVGNAFKFGEPGIYFAPPNSGTNPCGEIGLYPYVFRTGKAGWSMCNLTEINMSAVATEKEFYDLCRSASLIGTLQATYTNTGYLGEHTQYILEQEALLGVSLTGVCDATIDLDEHVLRRGAEIVKLTNMLYADKLGIKRASRTTCIKPSGTVSILAGTCSGIHPHHAPHYIRRVRISTLDPLYTQIKSKLPDAVEDIEGDPSTACVLFACTAKGKSKQQESTETLLNRVKLIQQHWVLPGTQVHRVSGLTHNVSNTISIKHDEIDMITDYIHKHQETIKGFALMPHFEEDATFKHLPMQTVTEDNELYKRLLANDWSVIDFTETKHKTEFDSVFCDSEKCFK